MKVIIKRYTNVLLTFASILLYRISTAGLMLIAQAVFFKDTQQSSPYSTPRLTRALDNEARIR